MRKFTLFFIITILLLPGLKLLAQNDTHWTILEYHPVNKYSCGLAFDGTYFYLGSYSSSLGSEIHRFNPQTGVSELLFNGPQTRAFGLTYDGQYLWLIDRIAPSSSNAFAMQLDLQGNLISQFDFQGYYMSGIAWDNGDFWISATSPSPARILKVNSSGEQLQFFLSPDNLPYDIAKQGEYLWIAANQTGRIYKTDLQGNVIIDQASHNPRASGVFHDGQYLWYVSRMINGDSFIYKVDPYGSGTPAVNLEPQINFGNILTGNFDTRNLKVTNSGQGALVIENIVLNDADLPFAVNSSFPISVQPGSSVNIPLVFSPEEIGFYSAIASVHTNDPFNRVKEVTLTGYGIVPGAFLISGDDTIDFGSVRLNSTSRGYLQLTNMGNTRAQVSAINMPGTEFYLDPQVTLPININSTHTVNIPFWFYPDSEGFIEGELEVLYNNAQHSPLVIQLQGTSSDRKFALGEKIWDYQIVQTPVNPRAILPIPDINGDGINEVVFSNRAGNIYCLNGNSSGNADLIWSISLGTVEYPKAIALLDDINGDGVQDFVAGTAWEDRAVTAISSRTGEIIWRYNTNQYGGGGWVYMVDVKYDYNNNGYRDVLAATGKDTNGNGPRRVFLLNGKTGEVIWSTFLGEAAFSVLAVEDFTGDGIPDVVAGATSTNGRGRVLGINGATGAIIWQTQVPSGTSVWALEQLGDITGNGIRDIIAGSYNGNGGYYFINATNGDIVFTNTLGTSLILDFWNAGDLNNDGVDDFIPAYTSVNNAVAICGQTGQLIWSTPVADQPWSIAPLGDINGDGINDVAVGTLYQQNRVYWLCGATGTVLEEVSLPAAIDVLRAMPDITGDASMEVIAGTRNGVITTLSGGTAVTPQPFDVTFWVYDSQQTPAPIANAVIVITQTGRSATTNAQGYAMIDVPAGDFNFTVSRQGFHHYEGSFQVIDQNVTVNVNMVSDESNAPALKDPMVVAFRNFPNPFEQFTNIFFTLTRDAEVSIVVYEMNARSFFLVKDKTFSAGENILKWDGTDESGKKLPNGMYFIEFRTTSNVFRNKVLIFRN
jgi:hypothetical protein